MKIYITGKFITAGQLLKKMDIISSGGQAKYFLENHEFKLNGERVQSRGTKIHIGDVIWINDELYQIVSEDL